LNRDGRRFDEVRFIPQHGVFRALARDFDQDGDLDIATVSFYPDYEKNDLVLYQLARAYEVAGETELALETLDRLVDEYPDTPHLIEAHFRRGETLFVEQRYAEAEDAYSAVLAHGHEVEFGEQSLYKLGWSLFKQLLHEESLEPR